jgi:DNA repair protein RAD57
MSDLQQNLKTPSLGLVWSNQIACRIALVRQASYDGSPGATVVDARLEDGSADWRPVRWNRWLRVVFAPWVEGVRPGEKGVEFELWRGGVRSVGEGKGRGGAEAGAGSGKAGQADGGENG